MRRLPISIRRRLLYGKTLRRPLDLHTPRRFTEKVNWRMVHDRRELLAWTCDKDAMKAHASRRAPDVSVPRTLWLGTDLSELAAVDLPERWILKPNHRSGMVVFGQGRPDPDALRSTTRGWLDEHNGAVMGEWAYSRARCAHLVEEVIDGLGEQRGSLVDYKFLVFDGVPRMINVISDRFTGGGPCDRFYRPDWTPLEVRASVYPPAPVVAAPNALDRMLDAAARIGAGFDFLRVDLYEVDGVVWFGETTPYPASGLESYDPDSFDFELGLMWRLPDQARVDVGAR